MNIKHKSLVFAFAFLLFSSFPTTVSAQEDNVINVTRFGAGRTRFIIADTNGGPPPGFFLAQYSRIYNALNSETNFGSEGTVSCEMEKLSDDVDYVAEGSLVDANGVLLTDVFFGPAIDTNLSEEEADELAKFVKSGGVLYLGGMGWSDSTPGRGPEYNLFFEKLGILDRFRDDNFVPGEIVQSMQPQESIITKDGPFGDVGPLSHTAYRQFEKVSLKEVVSTTADHGLIFESRVGKGYLVVMGQSLFVNGLMTGHNTNYFLNLFALGCDKSWQDNSVVLEVPSYKQIDPVWASDIYDNALNNSPLCGETMADCACALTSATMVMKYFGVNRDPNADEINPQTINNYFKTNSVGFAGPNFRWGYLGNFSSDANEALLGEQPKLEQPVRADFDLETVKVLIDNGKPVILRVNSNSHWVVVKGYDPDTNRLIINDPVRPDPPFGEYTYLDDFYTPDSLGSMILYETTNSDYRYLEFATDSNNHLLVEDMEGNRTGFDPETGQIIKEISNSDYALDPYYVSPLAQGVLPTNEGIYFLTLKLPEDGDFKLKIISQDGSSHPVHVYSSDIEGNLAEEIISPEDPEESYTFVYTEETAGEEVNMTKDEEEIEVNIEVEPLIKSNIIIPHKWFPIPVAILASESIDVTKIKTDSLTFGKTGTEDSLITCGKRLVDVNRDKKKDLLCYFSGDKTELDTSDTEVILRGIYESETKFVGKDNVKVIKPWFLF